MKSGEHESLFFPIVSNKLILDIKKKQKSGQLDQDKRLVVFNSKKKKGIETKYNPSINFVMSQLKYMSEHLFSGTCLAPGGLHTL